MTEFYYFGSEYTRYFDGLDAAWELACEQAALCMKAGILVFSPIAHGHAIAKRGRMDMRDQSMWLELNVPMMEAAKGLIYLKSYGWEESAGLRDEIAWFHGRARPVIPMRMGRAPIAEVLGAE